MKRILVTGAGGPAAVSLIKELTSAGHTVFAADMAMDSAGLYLVPKERRIQLLAGKHNRYQYTLASACSERRIQVLIPTVDAELIACAQIRDQLAGFGVRVLLASETSLHSCMDKYRLLTTCRSVVDVGFYGALTINVETPPMLPLVVKPRSGSGGRGVRVLRKMSELHRLRGELGLMFQEYLPGAEYSVDVLADGAGRALAAVPRERIRTDSGVAIAARTVHDPALEQAARTVVNHLKLAYVSNVQFKRNSRGNPILMEVNPRFPGSMPLTVAAGVNMPRLAVAALLGDASADVPPSFECIEMVRYLEERYLPAGTLPIATQQEPQVLRLTEMA